jgi:hypothetical protein
MKNPQENHAFSVELAHREHLKTVAMPSDGNSNALIEGFLGKLQAACFVEDSMLEIQGVNGTIRIDMTSEQFTKLLERQAQKEVKQ